MTNKQAGNGNLDLILAKPVPIETRTYKPVSHASIIDFVKEYCYKRNLNIINEKYISAADENKVVANYMIESGDPELKLGIAFKNSYDKSMSLGFAGGSAVFICSNGMIKGDVVYASKHSGSIITDLNHALTTTVELLDAEFEVLNKDKNRFKQIEVDKRLIHELTGRMFLEEEIINTEQLQIFKKEMNLSEHFKEQTAWSVYNWTTEALKKSHPLNYIEKHIKLHNLFEEQFN